MRELTELGTWPDGLPVLDAGMHANPVRGGCFMEYASLLAGERWSDRPRCTHPALAQLARLINDTIGDDARQQLVPLIPDVIGVVGDDPRIAPQLVMACLDRSHTGAHPRAARAARRAARRITIASRGGVAARWCRLTDAFYRAGPATRAMARAVRAIAAGDDASAMLRQLLREAIAVTARTLDVAVAPADVPAEVA